MRRPTVSPMHDERGVALLSALFAVALLTVIVIEMTDSTLVHTHLTRNAGNAMAAQLLARSAALAGEALITNDDANPQKRTCPADLWHVGIPQAPVGDGFASVRVVDEAGKLDLNGVRDEHYREFVKKLFSDLELDPSLVDRIATWITPENDPTMASGAASDYCALAMSCSPRPQPLHAIEELLLIRGFDEHALARLRPYATIVPRLDSKPGPAPKVNPLTADPLVLKAIGCEGTPPPDCPAALGGGDKGTEWETTFNDWKQKNCATAQGMLNTSSTVYSITAQGSVGDVVQTVRTTVRRTGDKVTPLWWQEVPLHAPAPVEAR